MRKGTVIVFIISLALGSSCSLAPAQTTVRPLPADTRQPTPAASPVPTDTVSPGNTPEPSDTPRPTDTAEPTDTPFPTPTDTPRPTSTPTPLPTFTLSGLVFFDYNGNGVQDDQEPPIPDATVQVGDLIAISAPDGTYSLDAVPQGQQAVKVSAQEYHYVSLSVEAFQACDQAVSVQVDGDTRRDWGLMKGFLTLPFSSPVTVQGMRYVDLNGEEPESIDWRGLGDREQYLQECYPTLDRHLGTDIYTGLGKPVLAAAPGTVFRIGGYGPEDGNLVGLFHPVFGPRNGFTTVYAHLESVSVAEGQVVERGEQIGTSGRTGAFRDCDPGHTHFQLNRSPTGSFEGRFNVICPFNERYWSGGTEAYPPY